MKLPKKIRDQFARAGRKGGKKKGKKGLAAMDPDKKREIQAAGNRKRREQAQIAREGKGRTKR